MTRPILRALAVGALALPGLACSHRSGADVTFGAAGPWTSSYGAMNKRGIDMAVEDINRSPLLGGRRLRVDAQDDGGDGTRAAKIAAHFVGDRLVTAVIGHVTSGAMVAASKIYDGALPAVATTATSPDITGISPWVFRVIPGDSANGVQIARFCEKLGRRRAAILYENDSYGRGLADAFARNFKGEVVSVDPIGADGKDVEAFVSYYMVHKPDVVFVAGTEVSGSAVIRESRRQHLDVDFVGGDGWSGIAGDTAAQGAYVSLPFAVTDPRPEAQAFVKAFRARYAMTPDQNAALAYDATMVVARAVAAVGDDRAKVRDYLASGGARGGAYAGVTGAIRFGGDGDPVGREFVMARVDRGELTVEGAR